MKEPHERILQGNSEVRIYRTRTGQYRWKCFGANYEVTSRGGQPFKIKGLPEHKIKLRLRNAVKRARRQLVVAPIRFDF